MHLKLRAKAGGRLEVLDGQGNPVDGVLSVEMFVYPGNPVPVVRIKVMPELVIDADAEVKDAKPTDPGLEKIASRPPPPAPDEILRKGL